MNFRNDYLMYYQEFKQDKQPIKQIRLGKLNPEKKLLLLEIDYTLLLISEEEIGTFPSFCFIDEELASRYNRRPFYIYLRPFTH
jgi:hypothetical protein